MRTIEFLDCESYDLLESTIKCWLIKTFRELGVSDFINGFGDKRGFRVGRAYVFVVYDCSFVYIGRLDSNLIDTVHDGVEFELNDPKFFDNIYDHIVKHNCKMKHGN